MIIVSKKDLENYELINHEWIHYYQQRNSLVIFFYVFYLLNFLINYLILRNFYVAYKNITFEIEAYENQQDFQYLKDHKNMMNGATALLKIQ